jgi:hypothetical protein
MGCQVLPDRPFYYWSVTIDERFPGERSILYLTEGSISQLHIGRRFHNEVRNAQLILEHPP